MRRLNLLLVITATTFLAVGLFGCNSPSTPTANPPTPSPPADSGELDHSDHTGHADHGGHDHGYHAQGETSPMDKMQETLAKLPEADRESAEKQHFCPVSGEMLGTMGLPIKVAADGQSAWICCGGCKDKFLGDPATYLAKVNKK